MLQPPADSQPVLHGAHRAETRCEKDTQAILTKNILKTACKTVMDTLTPTPKELNAEANLQSAHTCMNTLEVFVILIPHNFHHLK